MAHVTLPQLHIRIPNVPSRSPKPFTVSSCKQRRNRQAPKPTRATADDDDLKGGDGGLSSVFNQFVLVKGIPSPAAVAQRSHPSPLLPPTGVVEQTMEVLQRNDWPEPDTGIMTAFHFTQPAGQDGPDAGSVRSWHAGEEWLPWPRFHALLHTAYRPLLGCDSWRAVSPCVFPSSRHDNRAVQAVEVRARPRTPQQHRHGGQQMEEEAAMDQGGAEALRPYTYTFCLERQDSGAFKDCWLIAGVRIGNYAL
ncbi:hypothetical protein Agub_g3997 [Astrephomene gubernaculifera]|uniref:Uncharacterized protein n=1 Tax=Astrephomene gubernaculifera TaxID=47775 RepID=A0AAD3DLX2_9CHLO|nr:hypothetical protein Agub_g3997 [Astrephomene gubernaculifera]